MPLKQAFVRRVLSRVDAMLGVFIFDNFPICCTLELPWKYNHRFVSCIPTGEFLAQRVHSPNHGNTFQIVDVPNRTQILFHTANRIADLLGCIGLAEYYHNYSGEAGIANPYKGAAMQEFLRVTDKVDQFNLTIQECLT